MISLGASELRAAPYKKAPPGYPDIVFDKNGNVRPAYRGVIEIYQSMPEDVRRSVELRTLPDGNYEQIIKAFPRMFINDESLVLRKAFAQRGKAMGMFLEDHYSGRKNYLKDNVVDPRLVERAISRSGEGALLGRLKPGRIHFFYAPDLIFGNMVNGPQEKMWIVEDNFGTVGGLGDVVYTRESLLRNVPEYRPFSALDNPQHFFDTIVSGATQLAAKHDGIPVAVVPYSYLEEDKENQRLVRVLENSGVEVVQLDHYNASWHRKRKRRIESHQDGIWLRKTDGSRHKIGSLVNFGDAIAWDPHHPAVHDMSVLEELESQFTDGSPKKKKVFDEARKVVKGDPETGLIDMDKVKRILRKWKPTKKLASPSVIPGLISHYLGGRVEVINGPGASFLEDKEMANSIDDFIRYYLGEEPILRSVPTEAFADPDGGLDEAKLARWRRNYQNRVIKPYRGMGGEGVHVGPYMSSEDLVQVVEEIKTAPHGRGVQPLLRMGVLDGNLVDTRIHGLISVGDKRSGPRVYPALAYWGRQTPLKGPAKGKVNISTHASGTGVAQTFVVDPLYEESHHLSAQEKKVSFTMGGGFSDSSLAKKGRARSKKRKAKKGRNKVGGKCNLDLALKHVHAVRGPKKKK